MNDFNSQISRRQLIFGAAVALPAVALTRLPAQAQVYGQQGRAVAPYKVAPLPYDYDALRRTIDETTMRLHHDKHYAGYTKKLNAAVADSPDLMRKTPQELISNLDALPVDVRTAIRNNGGGYVNHSMFWQIMSPNGGGAPGGAIAEAIKRDFGSFASFQTKFQTAGENRFGSGFVWLVRDNKGKLSIMSTPNQDNPMMKEYGGLFPIMGNDVWEHAYYLKYNNRRADYLKAWWNVVNWDEINRRLAVTK